MTLEIDGIISEFPLLSLLHIQPHSSIPSAEADHLLKYSSLRPPLVDCKDLPHPTFLLLTRHIIPTHSISRPSLRTNYTNLPEKQELKLRTETASGLYSPTSFQSTTWCHHQLLADYMVGPPLFSVLISSGLSRSWLNTLFSSLL